MEEPTSGVTTQGNAFNEVREVGGMKRIIIAALALTLATAVQANPSDPIEAAADSLLNLIASVLPHFLWVIPAWFVASYFYNGMKHEKADRKRKEAEAFKVAVVMHRAQRFGDEPAPYGNQRRQRPRASPNLSGCFLRRKHCFLRRKPRKKPMKKPG